MTALPVQSSLWLLLLLLLHLRLGDSEVVGTSSAAVPALETPADGFETIVPHPHL